MENKLGFTGKYGPNDNGYIHQRIINCAIELKKAQELFSQGHYAHSNARVIPIDHPLRTAMEQLSKLDEMFAVYANKEPNKEMFSTYEPPIEDTTRWDKYPMGENGK